MPVEEQVVAIFAGTRGYLDKVEIGRIARFEAAMLGEIKAQARRNARRPIRDEREIGAPRPRRSWPPSSTTSPRVFA